MGILALLAVFTGEAAGATRPAVRARLRGVPRAHGLALVLGPRARPDRAARVPADHRVLRQRHGRLDGRRRGDARCPAGRPGACRSGPRSSRAGSASSCSARAAARRQRGHRPDRLARRAVRPVHDHRPRRGHPRRRRRGCPRPGADALDDRDRLAGAGHRVRALVDLLRPRRAAAAARAAATIWTWMLSHLPIQLAIVAAGAAIVSLIEHAHDPTTPPATALLLGGSVAIGLLALILTERSLEDAVRLEVVYRPLGAVLAAARRSRCSPAGSRPRRGCSRRCWSRSSPRCGSSSSPG